MFFNAIKHELIWFLKGDTNILYLLQNKVNIWNEWPYAKFKKSADYQNETLAEFKQLILTNPSFAKKYGELGPVYGAQWRNFNGVDQIKLLEKNLKEDPFSRRHIVSSWNPPKISQMLLPPCHLLFQLYVSEENKLSCQLYQRSADMFLGVPFNISSYSLLTLLLCDALGFEPGEFVHVLGDAHIYLNHLDAVKKQLKNKPLPLCQLKLLAHHDSILDYSADEISLVNYQSHPPIKAEVSV